VTSRSLFGDEKVVVSSPLADRMRPSSLDEVVGQDALVGPAGMLRAFVERGELPSLVFWGPPGCGKTTLARLLAAGIDAHLETFSAVLSGVKEARQIMSEARRRRTVTGEDTVLFVDEIHRFNRAQQDAFLPFIEAGDIVLLGATTENPSFELNRALLSRVKVVTLEPLGPPDLVVLLQRALADHERGLGDIAVEVAGNVLERIAVLVAGDARQALTWLEMSVQLAVSRGGDAVDVGVVEEVVQRATAVYDKGGEEHYNLISALHKSVRNSDVQASLYWLARMLEGGADPRFVVRRLLRIASEDVGMADPRALEQVTAAAHALDHIGMPEAELALAQATVYLALAHKSNRLYLAYGAAKREVRQRSGLAVPLHLRNAPTALMRDEGYGAGYRYAHDEPGRVGDMECLPEQIGGAMFYEPGAEGWEERIRARLDDIRRRRRLAREP
jgi:putative ATPase